MLSRIAENLYWSGRYVERAENTARLLNVNYHAIIEAPLVPGARGIVAEQWAPLLDILGDEESFREHYERADRTTVPEWLAFHSANPGSVRSCLALARENTRTLRDHISVEMWEALNRAYLSLCFNTEGVLERDALHDYCEEAREASALFFGIADATLSRDLGWYFLKAGQYLERADNVLRILMVRYRQYRNQGPIAQGVETHRGMALLKSIGAYEAYRKRSHNPLEPAHIAAFLLLDPNFPRSVRFSAHVLKEILQEIHARNPGTSLEPARLSGWLSAKLEHMRDASSVIDHEEPSLESLLDELAEISLEATRCYFHQPSHTPQPPLQTQSQRS